MASPILTDDDFTQSGTLTDADFSGGLTDADFADAPKPPLLTASDFRPAYQPTAEEAATVQAAQASGRPVVIRNGVATVGAEAQQPTAPFTVGDAIARGATSVAKGAAMTGQGALQAAEYLKPQFDLSGPKQFLRDVEDRAAEDYQVDPARDTAFTSKVIDVAGQMVPIMASGGTLAPVTGALMMGEGQRRDAEEAGATKQEQQAAFGLGAATGLASEALLGLPALLRSAKVASAGAKSVGRQVAEQGAKGFVREGTQEAIEQAGGNVTANTIIGYDPERPAMKGVGEAALLGGIVGGPMGAGVQALASADAARSPAGIKRAQEAASTELGRQMSDFPKETYTGSTPLHPNDTVVSTERRVSGPVNNPVISVVNTYETSDPTTIAAMKARQAGAPMVADALTAELPAGRLGAPAPLAEPGALGAEQYGREMDAFDVTSGLKRKPSAEAAQEALPPESPAEPPVATRPAAEPAAPAPDPVTPAPLTPRIAEGKTTQDIVSDAMDVAGTPADAWQHLQTQIDHPRTSEVDRGKMQKAQQRIANALESEARREAELQAEGDLSGTYELISSVKELGGLPATSVKGKESSGELSRIKEAQKGAAMALFRKDGKSLDTLREALAERGFQFETPDAMLAAIEDSMRSGVAQRGTKFPEGYMGGPGAMSPAESGEMSAGQVKIGAAKDIVTEQRAKRGLDPLKSKMREENPVTWDAAVERVERDPGRPSRLVDDIIKGEKKSTTRDEKAEILYEMTDLSVRLENETVRSQDANATPEARAEAHAAAESIETQLRKTEEAARMAGSDTGAALQFMQVLANDDYTFGGLMRRKRKEVGNRDLTVEEIAKAKKEADDIANAQKEADFAAEKQTKRDEDADLDAKIAAYEKARQAESETQSPYSKAVLDWAERMADAADKKADAAREFLKKDGFFGSESGAVGGVGGPKGEGKPLGNRAQEMSRIKALADIITARIIRFGANRAKNLEAIIVQYPQAGPYFDKAYKLAVKAHDKLTYGKPSRVKAAITDIEGTREAGVKKKTPKSKDALIGQGKADIEAGDGLSHKTVAEIVNGFIDAGVRDRTKLFQMSHDVVKEFMPEATERDVRRAYVEYGKKTFPNPDEVATFRRNVRQAAKIEEDIARLENEKLRPEKQGYQRDKIDIQIRDLQKRRGELLKDIDLPPEPGAFASKDEAKQTRIKNRIEEINRELATGQKPPGGTPPAPDSVQTEQLRSELAAMEEKLKEVRALEDPPLSEAQKALDSAMVARERAAQTLDDIAGGKLKPDAKGYKEALTQLEEDVRLETAAMRQLATEMRRDAKPKGDPGYLKERAQIKALERAIERYAEKQGKGDFASKGKVNGPDSATVARLKGIRDSRAAAYKAAKDAGKPVLTPEQRYNAQRARALEKREKELTERIKNRDFGPRPKKISPKLDRANLDAQAKVNELKAEIDFEFKKQELAKRPLWKKALAQLAEIRGVILGSDIGVLTRQGGFSWSRPHHAIPALVNAAKAAVSPDSAKRWEVRMQNRKINGEPVAPIRKAANLQTTDTLNHPEELAITRLLSRLPDVKVGNRTVKLSAIGRTFERFQTTFINDARMRTFDAGVKAGLTPEELKVRAHAINNMTGRGNMKYVPEILTTIMTSPRYESSRWGTIAEPARNIIILAKNVKNREPLNRGAKANLQDLSVTAGGLLALMWMVAEWTDYDLNLDPYSSDFLKLRKGDEVWDLSMGLAPRIRDIMRIQQLWSQPDTARNLAKVGWGTLSRTVNPAIKTGFDQSSVLKQRYWDGNDEPNLPFTGFRSDEEREGLITLAPLIWQSFSETLREEGVGAASWAASREFIGQSVSRYPAPE